MMSYVLKFTHPEDGIRDIVVCGSPDLYKLANILNEKKEFAGWFWVQEVQSINEGDLMGEWLWATADSILNPIEV
jgi:hypothetical protein